MTIATCTCCEETIPDGDARVLDGEVVCDTCWFDARGDDRKEDYREDDHDPDTEAVEGWCHYRNR